MDTEHLSGETFAGQIPSDLPTQQPRLAIAEHILRRPLPEPWSWRYLDDLLHWAIDVEQEPLHSQAHLYLANILASHFHEEVSE